jgi:hypothetical protein
MANFLYKKKASSNKAQVHQGLFVRIRQRNSGRRRLYFQHGVSVKLRHGGCATVHA